MDCFMIYTLADRAPPPLPNVRIGSGTAVRKWLDSIPGLLESMRTSGVEPLAYHCVE